jgi:transposase
VGLGRVQVVGQKLAVNRRFELTDDEWQRLAPLLPAMTPQRGGRWRDHRQVLNGILFRVRTGIPWRDLPERYGPWETADKRFARWPDRRDLGQGRGRLAHPGRCGWGAGLGRPDRQ